MFVELDTRHNAGYTVSLEWDRETGETQIVVADARDESVLGFRVRPRARSPFLKRTSTPPVLSAGPTPRTPLEEWTLQISGAVDDPVSWIWHELLALPAETPTVDIHCVTSWSKLDTTWKGVSVDTLLAEVETEAEYGLAWCDGAKGLVALTVGCLALGTYIRRDLTGGAGIALSIGAVICVIGLNSDSASGRRQLAPTPVFALGPAPTAGPT